MDEHTIPWRDEDGQWVQLTLMDPAEIVDLVNEAIEETAWDSVLRHVCSLSP